MVQFTDANYLLEDGSVDLDRWLAEFTAQHNNDDNALVREACFLARIAGEGTPTLTAQTCLQQGLQMAEILRDMKQDAECIAAAIVSDSTRYGELSEDVVREALGETVERLVTGVKRMDASSAMQTYNYNPAHIENIRMMLLAMVEDVRVVLIKLAEHLCVLRTLDPFPPEERRSIAQETLNIYAPLANRLGLMRVRWELEDRAFRYLDPINYKAIAGHLGERRINRDQYLKNTLEDLRSLVSKEIENFEINGRIKHIYGIFRKMSRKQVGFEEIYDVTAVRVLVPNVEACYKVLSLIHNTWPQIPEEFDDYIATPKSNGYRSIHTAVVGPNNKNIEVQIRTHEMHQESELGVAAHWIYKEGAQQKPDHEAKIAWLRQVIAWQKEISTSGEQLSERYSQLFDDRVYVFTPKGEVFDLQEGSTPLDFAYRIHTEVGHRCRGAKINDRIAPLNTALKTGDQIEILTAKRASPSRDWVSPHSGYLKTPRAKAKVLHWFSREDFEKNHHAGFKELEQACKNLGIEQPDFSLILEKFNYKDIPHLYAAVGQGKVGVQTIIHALQKQIQPEETLPLSRESTYATSRPKPSDIHVAGIGKLMTKISQCCQPLPGEPILGYITLGQGLSIHREDCKNILRLSHEQKNRLLEAEWGAAQALPNNKVSLEIIAYDRQGLVRDISELLAKEKINLVALNTLVDTDNCQVTIKLTIMLSDFDTLNRILNRLKQIQNISSVRRLKETL